MNPPTAQAQTKRYTCPSCKDKGFTLSNLNGRVQVDACSCFHCAKCDGEGRIFQENEKGISYLAACDCTLLKKRFRILEDAGIPGKFVHADFDSFIKHHQTQGRAKRVAMDFVQDFLKAKNNLSRGMIFMGAPGLGKTHLAVAVIKALTLEQGIDCRFVDFFQLLSDIRHGFSEDMSDQAFIKPYQQARVLVIDELAKGRNTEWELTVLDQLISNRYNAADKVTIFTTNYSVESKIAKEVYSGEMEDQNDRKEKSVKNYADGYMRESLQEKIGARIYSRLAEMCKFVMIQGQDLRQKGMAVPHRYPRP
ncbi:MAG: DNA replication protein DnaC [Nitrospinaceae bacterium]|nr:MAG: DNA replication protein DnaC [Nitrospinaceae bacterium]